MVDPYTAFVPFLYLFGLILLQTKSDYCSDTSVAALGVNIKCNRDLYRIRSAKSYSPSFDYYLDFSIKSEGLIREVNRSSLLSGIIPIIVRDGNLYNLNFEGPWIENSTDILTRGLKSKNLSSFKVLSGKYGQLLVRSDRVNTGKVFMQHDFRLNAINEAESVSKYFFASMQSCGFKSNSSELLDREDQSWILDNIDMTTLTLSFISGNQSLFNSFVPYRLSPDYDPTLAMQRAAADVLTFLEKSEGNAVPYQSSKSLIDSTVPLRLMFDNALSQLLSTNRDELKMTYDRKHAFSHLKSDPNMNFLDYLKQMPFNDGCRRLMKEPQAELYVDPHSKEVTIVGDADMKAAFHMCFGNMVSANMFSPSSAMIRVDTMPNHSNMRKYSPLVLYAAKLDDAVYKSMMNNPNTQMDFDTFDSMISSSVSADDVLDYARRARVMIFTNQDRINIPVEKIWMHEFQQENINTNGTETGIYAFIPDLEENATYRFVAVYYNDTPSVSFRRVMYTWKVPKLEIYDPVIDKDGSVERWAGALPLRTYPLSPAGCLAERFPLLNYFRASKSIQESHFLPRAEEYMSQCFENDDTSSLVDFPPTSSYAVVHQPASRTENANAKWTPDITPYVSSPEHLSELLFSNKTLNAIDKYVIHLWQSYFPVVDTLSILSYLEERDVIVQPEVFNARLNRIYQTELGDGKLYTPIVYTSLQDTQTDSSYFSERRIAFRKMLENESISVFMGMCRFDIDRMSGRETMPSHLTPALTKFPVGPMSSNPFSFFASQPVPSIFRLDIRMDEERIALCDSGDELSGRGRNEFEIYRKEERKLSSIKAETAAFTDREKWTDTFFSNGFSNFLSAPQLSKPAISSFEMYEAGSSRDTIRIMFYNETGAAVHQLSYTCPGNSDNPLPNIQLSIIPPVVRRSRGMHPETGMILPVVELYLPPYLSANLMNSSSQLYLLSEKYSSVTPFENYRYPSVLNDVKKTMQTFVLERKNLESFVASFSLSSAPPGCTNATLRVFIDAEASPAIPFSSLAKSAMGGLLQNKEKSGA